MKNPEIPKIIHYCWFGRNPLPPLAEKCIASWQKFLPDYEIKEWNEDNFDVGMNPYIEEAYHMKKYAFVSDFARFYILYHHGGIYFDVDVEILKPIDDILARGPYMGLEKMEGTKYSGTVAVAAGLGMASYPKLGFFGEVIDFYSKTHFISWRGKTSSTVVKLVTNLLIKKGDIDLNNISECCGIYIYPDDYFDPMNYYTKDITITDNTRTIHHYAATWVEKRKKRGLEKHKERFNNLLLRLKLSFKRVFNNK